MDDNIPVNTVAETDEYVVWTSEEPDGEKVYHVELGALTIHLFQEEWNEFIDLIDAAKEALS